MRSAASGTSISATAAIRSSGRSPSSSARCHIYSGFRGTSSGPAIELAYELTEWFKPEGMVRAFFTSGGSDLGRDRAAARAAILENQGIQADRTKFLALKKGYHGTHFGGASVNGAR